MASPRAEYGEPVDIEHLAVGTQVVESIADPGRAELRRLEVGVSFSGMPCPPPGVKYHDANGNGAYDNGEDIVLDVNDNGVFD